MKSTLFTLVFSIGTAAVAGAYAQEAHYPPEQGVSTGGKSRAEVVAERDAAGRVTNHESHYPAEATGDVGQGKTRAQVVAETAAARRLGLMDVSDHELPRIATPAEERIIADAGRQAVLAEQHAEFRSAQRAPR